MVSDRSHSSSWAATAVTAFCVLIALAGWSVSYATQAELALTRGFPSWEGWVWPSIADAGALAVMLRLALNQVRPGLYTVEAWLFFGICCAIMVAANTFADRRDLLSAGMHAIVPIVPMLLWHLVVHGRPIPTIEGESEERPIDSEHRRSRGTPQQTSQKRTRRKLKVLP